MGLFKTSVKVLFVIIAFTTILGFGFILGTTTGHLNINDGPFQNPADVPTVGSNTGSGVSDSGTQNTGEIRNSNKLKNKYPVPTINNTIRKHWDNPSDLSSNLQSSGTTSKSIVESQDVEHYIFQKINEKRKDHGKDPLEYSYYLSSVSIQHSQSMGNNNYFSHKDMHGRQPWERINKWEQKCPNGVAENIAYTWGGQRTEDSTGKVDKYYTEERIAEQIVYQWMHSSSHREALLSSQYDAVGTGVYIVQEQDTSIKIYATQDFCGFK